MEGFARGAISSKAASLPSRTLLLLTEAPPPAAEFGSLAVEYVAEAPAWIEERLDQRYDSRGGPPTHSGLATMTGAFTELAVQFGPSASLVGILTRPPSEVPVRRPAVVILNTGIAHRVGHHRMYVKLARVLAALGHLVFRFDFSGIGDSASRGDSLNPIEAHQADVRDALNWLTASCGVNEAILIGLCAGAEIALKYGHSDQRVSGLVLLDPTIPPTAAFLFALHCSSPNPASQLVVIRQRTWPDLGGIERAGEIGLRYGSIASCEHDRSGHPQRARAIVPEVS